MNVTGTGMVFRNEHETNGETWYSYNISVSSKKLDGEYVSTSVPIRFKKGVMVENKTRIDIKKGFLTVREYTKDGDKKKILEIMCMEFGTVTKQEDSGFMPLQDEDIPF